MLDQEDLSRLREIFVTCKACEEAEDKNLKRFSALEKESAVINTKLNALISILTSIGVAVLGIAVKLLFGI